MNKLGKSIGMFALLSTSLWAAQMLEQGNFDMKKQEFVVGASKVAEGKYEMKEANWEAEFEFRKGKLEKFSFEEKMGTELDIDVRFLEQGKKFQGEMEVSQRKEISPESKEKKTIEIKGELDSPKIYDFAKQVWSEKGNVNLLNYEEISSLTVIEGQKKLEEELSKTTQKKGNGKSYYQVEMTEKEEIQVFSKGKVVGQSQASSSRSEVRSKMETSK